MNVLKVAVIGTMHLSLQTRQWMEGLDWKKEGPSGGDVGYGWYVYAHDDNTCSPSPAHAPDGEFPADLWATFEAARAAGCAYVRIDCDEDVIVESLTTYDDHPAPVDANGELVPGEWFDVIESQHGLWRAVQPYLDDDGDEFDTLEECLSNLAHSKAPVRRVRDNLGNAMPQELAA